MENEKDSREMIKKLLLGLLTALLASAYCSFLILIVLSFLSLIIPKLNDPKLFNAFWLSASVSTLYWITMNPHIYKNFIPLQNSQKS